MLASEVMCETHIFTCCETHSTHPDTVSWAFLACEVGRQAAFEP